MPPDQLNLSVSLKLVYPSYWGLKNVHLNVIVTQNVIQKLTYFQSHHKPITV